MRINKFLVCFLAITIVIAACTANNRSIAANTDPLPLPDIEMTETATVSTTVELSEPSSIETQDVSSDLPTPEDTAAEPPDETPDATAAVSEAEESPEPPSPKAPDRKAAAPKAPSTVIANDQGIVFNFDDADIHEVVATVSEILGFNYIIDPRIVGKVNIHTREKISKKELFSVLETVLKLCNATIIERGEFYHIIPLIEVSQSYILPHLAVNEEDLPIRDKFIIQVVPLRFVSATELATLVKPFMSAQGSTVVKDNLLIILDFSANIRKLLSLIELFDTDIFEQLHMQLYEVKHSDVEELATDLDTIFQAFKLSSEDVRTSGIKIVPITRLNLLLAVSANDKLLEKALQWAQKLDTEVSETTMKIHVYYVQNGKAVDIADVLTQVFTGTQQKQGTTFKSKLAEKETSAKPTKATPAKTQPARSPAQTERTEEVSGEVQIVVDETNNALIIQATERDYRIVEKTLKQLDIYPKQVLIEVLIAEIRLDDDMKMGVEWEYMNDIGQSTAYTTRVTGVTDLTTEITSGLYYLVDKTDRFKATIRAFAAKDKVNILSSPHIIASDNKEASINITEEIPIVSGMVTTSTDNPLITETVEYRDTGIILKVTPHINDKGLVTLDVSQEVSEQSTRAATGSSNPIFLKRSAQTSMVVQDRQSVIIGGLIKESWTRGKSGVPILSSIPVVGALFGYQKKTVNRSELMLLLTPHVIKSIDDADSITREFRDKLDIIKNTKQSGSDTLRP